MMEESESVQCPYCGQSFELAIDTSVASQRFTTDCEVCCRPFEVLAVCEAGEVLSVEGRGGLKAPKTKLQFQRSSKSQKDAG